ncbi:MAG: hypothetical protein MPJ50_19550 [Pirellulales bacterium]|nr:hypothetical protein [Pirellulales bacterium]
MSEVLRPPESPRVLFIGNFRSDETDDSPFLNRWHELRSFRESGEHLELGVGPLTVEQCIELMVARVGRDNEVVRRQAVEFCQETGGNALFINELIDCFDPDADSFQPLSIQEVIERKLSQLPDDAVQLLDVIAVAGQAICLNEAAEAVGYESLPVATINHMRTAQLVRYTGSEDELTVDTYHDRIRETALEQQDVPARRELHRKLAEVIESRALSATPVLREAIELGEIEENTLSDARIYDLSYHFNAAGDKAKAWKYALLAAEQAKRTFAFEVAAEQYKIAKRNSDSAPDSFRFRIGEGYGESLLLSGRYTKADQAFANITDLTDDALERARIECFQGELAYKRGDVLGSIHCYETALRRLGQNVPRSRMGTFFSLLAQVGIQACHTILPTTWYQRKKPAGAKVTLTGTLLDRLSMSNWWVFTPNMLWAHLAAMNLAERFPPTRQLVFSYGLHAAPVSVLGMFNRGYRYGQRAIELSKEMNDLWGQGHTYNFRGMGLVGGARYEQSLDDVERAINLLGQTGDAWELTVAEYHRALNHYRLGNVSNAIEAAIDSFQHCVLLGDDGMAQVAIDVWSKSTLGRLPFEELAMCFRSLPSNTMSANMKLQAEGRWHLQHCRTGEAIECFDQARRMARDGLVINMYTVPSVVWLAAALREHADSVETSERAPLQKKALKFARISRRLGRFFPQDLPQAYREIALVLDALGNSKRALRHAQKSCAVALSQNAKHEHAQSALVCGKLRKKLGLDNADSKIAEAESELAGFQDMIETAMASTATRLAKLSAPETV